MIIREDLIKELQSCERECSEIDCCDCPHFYSQNGCFTELIADHLASHGYVSGKKRRSWVKYALIVGYVFLAVSNALVAGTAPNLFCRVANTLTAIAYILVSVLMAME